MKQRGAALLLAMLTVVLVATLASAALWQQWRSVEVESAERTRTQLSWVLTGALDWGRLILREDARTNQVDHLSEPWALPLQEARLSSFLAVDQNNTDDAMEAFLSGQMTDQQGLLNVANLVADGKPSAVGLRAFGKLFTQLNLPSEQLEDLAEHLVQASAAGQTASLLPTRVEQLTWLGLPQQSLRTLKPYITLLPVPTPVNLNTAPAEVLYAVLPELDMGQAQRMVQSRAAAHYVTVADALASANMRAEQTDMELLSVSSRFFTVRGRLRIGDTTVQEVSLVERQGMTISVLWRQRESLDVAMQGIDQPATSNPPAASLQ